MSLFVAMVFPVNAAHAVWRDCRFETDRVIAAPSGSAEYLRASASALRCLAESREDQLSRSRYTLASKRQSLEWEEQELADVLSGDLSILWNGVTGGSSTHERAAHIADLRDQIEVTHREVKSLEREFAQLTRQAEENEAASRSAE